MLKKEYLVPGENTQVAAKGYAGHRENAQVVAKGYVGHHENAQVAAKGYAGHHENPQVPAKGYVEHRENAQVAAKESFDEIQEGGGIQRECRSGHCLWMTGLQREGRRETRGEKPVLASWKEGQDGLKEWRTAPLID